MPTLEKLWELIRDLRFQFVESSVIGRDKQLFDQSPDFLVGLV